MNTTPKSSGDRPEAREPAARPQLSLVLPAYNEAENLTELLDRLRATLREGEIAAEILVVDTMEPMDATPEICARAGVRYVPRRESNVYGSAIRTGIAASTGEYVLIMDVDGSHEPEFIRHLWEAREQADVIIASRYIRGGSTDNPPLLVFFSRLLNTVFKLVLQLPVWDVSNSFRLYRGDPLRELSLDSSHFDIQEELLAKFLWHPTQKTTVLEIPFRFQRRRFGTSKRSMVVFLLAFLSSMFRLYRLKGKLRAAAAMR